MKYRANPVIVTAFKITGVAPEQENGNTELFLLNAPSVVADPAMKARYYPTIGDYYVIQGDNYHYLNPRDVFERKYSPIMTE